MNFFPQRPETNPMIYAYQDTNPQYAGLLKVGYTSVDVEKRVAEQYPTKRPDGSVPYRIVFAESAMYPDGTSFSDHDVHRMLTAKGIQCVGGEWFRCDVQDVKAAVIAVRNRTVNIENRTRDFSIRPEQQAAVDKTIAYFDSLKTGEFPRFLWNAKMRFGKTFATYQLAKKKGFKIIGSSFAILHSKKPIDFNIEKESDKLLEDLLGSSFTKAMESGFEKKREEFYESFKQ